MTNIYNKIYKLFTAGNFLEIGNITEYVCFWPGVVGQTVDAQASSGIPKNGKSTISEAQYALLDNESPLNSGIKYILLIHYYISWVLWSIFFNPEWKVFSKMK